MGKGGKGRARTYSANDMRSMAKNPTSSHRKAAMDNRANQLNPVHPAYQKGQAGSRVSAGGTGLVFAEEESGFNVCGFCGAGPFEGITPKMEHHRDAHGISEGTPGCEPHGLLFASRAEYERHYDEEHIL